MNAEVLTATPAISRAQAGTLGTYLAKPAENGLLPGGFGHFLVRTCDAARPSPAPARL